MRATTDAARSCDQRPLQLLSSSRLLPGSSIGYLTPRAASGPAAAFAVSQSSRSSSRRAPAGPRQEHRVGPRGEEGGRAPGGTHAGEARGLQTAGGSSLQGFAPPRVYHAAPVVLLELSRAY